jgi:GTPase SAR1 family protein
MKIILIVGLPGSGKSTLVKNSFSNSSYKVFDDFNANAVVDNGEFTYSKYYPELIEAVKVASHDIVISDISFCKQPKFRSAIRILKWWVNELSSNYTIEAILFENEERKCINNVKKDTSRYINGRLQKIAELSPEYKPQILAGLVKSIIKDVHN